jgi:hypothetical protein
VIRFVTQPSEGDRTAERFLRAMKRAPIDAMIRNVHAELSAIEAGGSIFPLTVSDARDENSYVCSPYTTYVSYAREELPKLGNASLERALGAVIKTTGAVLERGRVDDVVFVNNWLLSTNLYPASWRGDELDELTQRCVARWPGHAIAFRSLNEGVNRELLSRFSERGWFLLPSRQVYLFDGVSGGFAERHNTRIDLALLARGDEIVPHERIEPGDFDRLEQLYRMLYLDKYSYLNPQYTAEFLRAAHDTGWIRFTALRREGAIDGVLGTFEIDGTITAPVVGYDTSAPKSRALYRRLMALVLREALERKLTLNLSSGAAEFKRLRGGEPSIEYTAVYDRHLPVTRRAVWRSLAALVDRIGVPLLRRYEL